MTMSYQFGDVGVHVATIRAQAAAPEAEHQAFVVTQLVRNFQLIYEQANAHGSKVQTAGGNMSSTDSTACSSWA